MIGPILMSMGVKLIALIGGVGLLSAKAIVVAKLALFISVILLAQSYFSNRVKVDIISFQIKKIYFFFFSRDRTFYLLTTQEIHTTPQ